MLVVGADEEKHGRVEAEGQAAHRALDVCRRVPAVDGAQHLVEAGGRRLVLVFVHFLGGL